MAKGGAVAPARSAERWAGVGLLLIAIVWGGTFPVVKDLVERVPPHALVASRFALAWLVLAGWVWRRRDRWQPGLWRAGLLLGLVLWGGFFTQTLGLQYTSASKAGFITALNVVFVAVLATLFLGKRSGLLTWSGVAVATVGLAVLSLDGQAGLRLELGDGLVLFCAVLFALHIVLVDRFAPRYDPVLLAWVQMGLVAAVAGASAWVVHGGLVGITEPGSVVPLLYLGLLATAGALVGQVHLQRYTAPARVGLILALEPVFAAWFAWLLLGERLAPSGWLGGGMVLAGVILAELDTAKGSARGAPVEASGERAAPAGD
ncbi:MAG TPA: DMT family transporter [Limnochordales bacterium]|nr:DMT family transporter [Limnochordales bacterium]